VRSRTVSFGGLLIGGLLAEVATAQPWWRATGGGATAVFKGTEATGGLSQALALVSLAGTLLVLVVGVRGRRVVAVLLALAGLGTLLAGALHLRPDDQLVLSKLRQLSLVDGVDAVALTSTGWPWAYALAGLLVLGGAIVLLLRAGSWPLRSDRFARSGPAPAETASEDPAAVWKALDAGLDPTADGRGQRPSRGDSDVTSSGRDLPRPDVGGPDLHRPDVENGNTRDTMDGHTDSDPANTLGRPRNASD